MIQNRTTKRNGTILAMALVCLLVVSVFSLSATRHLVDQHRLTTHQQYRLQSLWLAESAQRRAVAMLNLDQDYEGETWHVQADTFANGKAGVAVIQVTKIATDLSQRQIVIESRYPDSDVHRVAHRMQLRIELPEDSSETIP
ncbi:MAG: hypothetical protein H8E44_31735 [Planctomycetes bacterium]|nr:hypothetical protein [Planctomycetota bacterium]